MESTFFSVESTYKSVEGTFKSVDNHTIRSPQRMPDRQRCPEATKLQHFSQKPNFSTNMRRIYARIYGRRKHLAILKSDATIHVASRGMSGLGAVICSWEDEGGVTVSDLTLSNSWATKTTVFWIFRGRRNRQKTA